MDNFIQEEDEDVVLEGSELHRALLDMGYTNFDSAPKVKESFNYQETDLAIIENYNSKSLKERFSENVNSIYQLICEDNILKRRQLEIILKSNIILDDHATTINEFYSDHSVSKLRYFFENIPFISSAVSATCYMFYSKSKSIKSTALIFTILGLFVRIKYKHWIMSKKLRHLVALQNELHNLIKKNLKILRRNFRKKSVITGLHEKQEMLGSNKYNAVLTMREFTIDVFQNLIQSYYRNSRSILYCLPCSFYDVFTGVDIEPISLLDENRYNKNYDEIKTMYYNYILVQSELMYMIACAYHGKMKNKSFQCPKLEIYAAVTNLIKVVNMYYGIMTEIIERYETCDIQPIQRVFKGLPNSKWQDTYIHLDLTSQRIQLAYKEIQLILEVIDTHLDNNDDPKLINIISEKMSEAYKQIENAKNFAEFSTLLIAKAQCKPANKAENDNENENLFPNENDNRAIVVIDRDREIEDEVFEEYIKEEYLKPLYENSEGALEDYKLDKLLAKNFMTELKEALIEKQKSMSEREFRALKRMYNMVRRESIINKAEIEKSVDDKPVISIPLPPPPPTLPPPPPTLPPPPPTLPPPPPTLPPPPPPLPPPMLENTVIAENDIEESGDDQKKNRGPVPLPRVKMLQPNDEITEVQRFSISECTPNFRFPPFKVAEETFLGSGENSEEEYVESDSDAEEVADN